MEFVKDLFSYIIVIGIVLVLRIYVIAPTEVVGFSMTPTLTNGDITLLDKITYDLSDIKRFDVIVLDYNETRFLIKRVVGLPGEEIKYIDNVLYVNDKKVEEIFINGKETIDFSSEELGSKKIPNDKYLVLGDNRGDSMDSRKIGFIEKSDIIGKTRIILFPFKNITIVH